MGWLLKYQILYTGCHYYMKYYKHHYFMLEITYTIVKLTIV